MELEDQFGIKIPDEDSARRSRRSVRLSNTSRRTSSQAQHADLGRLARLIAELPPSGRRTHSRTLRGLPTGRPRTGAGVSRGQRPGARGRTRAVRALSGPSGRAAGEDPLARRLARAARSFPGARSRCRLVENGDGIVPPRSLIGSRATAMSSPRCSKPRWPLSFSSTGSSRSRGRSSRRSAGASSTPRRRTSTTRRSCRNSWPRSAGRSVLGARGGRAAARPQVHVGRGDRRRPGRSRRRLVEEAAEQEAAKQASKRCAPPEEVWRNTGCAARPRCPPPGLRPQSRPYLIRYGRSCTCLGTGIAPWRRALFRQTLLGSAIRPRH